MTAFGKLHRSITILSRGPEWAVYDRLDFPLMQNAAGRHSVKRALSGPSPQLALRSAAGSMSFRTKRLGVVMHRQLMNVPQTLQTKDNLSFRLIGLIACRA